MKKLYIITIYICTVLLLATVAFSQVTLNSVRIGAKDTVALAKFYQSAFGMHEVNRKVRLLRQLYPEVNIKILYERDYKNLIWKYGLGQEEEENGSGAA